MTEKPIKSSIRELRYNLTCVTHVPNYAYVYIGVILNYKTNRLFAARETLESKI